MSAAAPMRTRARFSDPRPVAPGVRPPCAASIIIPVMNEEENVGPLYEELHEVMSASGVDYEVIFVDDGSKDDTLARLTAATHGDPRVTIVQLRRNFGQTAAMSAGIEHSRGRVLVFMDGDRQNDPHDIPPLLARLEAPPPCDIVSGWRRKRHDKLWTRRLPSQMANRLIRWVTGVRINDFGCTLKAYRREVLEGVGLYSELHRLLPALAVWQGAKVAELVVNHRPRVAGRTKYGLRRTIKVLLDLVTVKFLGAHMTKPLYFFGKIGLVTGGLSMLTLAVAIGQKFGHFGQPERVNLNNNILVSLSALMLFFTVQCVLFGVVSELLVRIHHDSGGKPTYRVRRVIQSGAEDANRE